MMQNAPPEPGLGGETFIPSSGSRRRLAFLSRTQTLTKLEKRYKNGALPPARAEIHSASMAIGPPETGWTGAGAGGRQKSRVLGRRRLGPELTWDFLINLRAVDGRGKSDIRTKKSKLADPLNPKLFLI